MEDDEQPLGRNPQPFLVTAVVMELALGAVAVGLGWILGPDPRQVVPPLDQPWELFRGIGLGMLAALPLVGAVQLLERIPLDAIRNLQKATEERLIALLAGFSVLELGLISLCAGVGEELLFRGWLMMSLAGPVEHWQAGTLIPAVIVSSIVFGLAHPITPAYVVVTGVIGVFMGMLLVWSGNLLVPIAAHAFYDFIQLMIATRMQDKPQTA